VHAYGIECADIELEQRVALMLAEAIAFGELLRRLEIGLAARGLAVHVADEFL
jgi:hypothetical protein